MKLLLLKFVLILLGVGAINLDLINILLTGKPNEIHQIPQAREAIIDSVKVFDKIHLTNHQKQVIWEVYINETKPENLTASDLATIAGLLSAIPEDDLYQLNVSDWNITKVLGQVKTFSRPQASIIINSITNIWTSSVLGKAKYINQLSGLICGFHERSLANITTNEFKKINASVFRNLFACSDKQLKALLDNFIHIYGVPQSWSEDLVKAMGMMTLVLDTEEIRSLRPSALKGLDLETITNLKPQLLDAFSDEQIRSFSPFSKMVIHQNIDLLKPNSGDPPKIDKICLLLGLLLRTYLLLIY